MAAVVWARVRLAVELDGEFFGATERVCRARVSPGPVHHLGRKFTLLARSEASSLDAGIASKDCRSCLFFGSGWLYEGTATPLKLGRLILLLKSWL